VKGKPKKKLSKKKQEKKKGNIDGHFMVAMV